LLEQLRRAPLLVVSPHLDDAALSCAVLLERDVPVDVVTVFAGLPDRPRATFWDEICGFADSGESIPARRKEEELAFNGSCHRVSHMDLLESGYLDGQRDAADGVAIGEVVNRWIARNAAAPVLFVAAPVGAGMRRPRWRERAARIIGPKEGLPQHPDHLFVRDATLRAVSASSALLVLYEELPYVFSHRGDEEALRVARRSRRRRLLQLALPVDLDTKAHRLAAYASQVPHLRGDGTRLDDPARLPPTERYWILEA
jgi:LmbE family N-acetylglucosaminyl deacetylase